MHSLSARQQPPLGARAGAAGHPRRRRGRWLGLLALSLGLGVGARPDTPPVSFVGAQTPVPANGLSTPTGVAVDEAGNVFIADADNNRVVKVPADGGPQTTLSSALRHPTAVAVDGAGNVFIADTVNNRVVKVPVDSGAPIPVGSGLALPRGVAVDGTGNVFIADTGNNRVVKVPVDGSPQTPVPANGLYNPTGVAVDRAGNVFIADPFNNRVVKVPVDGSPQIPVFANDLSNPTGVAVDRAGNVFIADPFNNRVVKVPADGGPQPPVFANGLYNPVGVAVDGAGVVFVADSNNNRVLAVQIGSVDFERVNVCPADASAPAPCSRTWLLNYTLNDNLTLGPVRVLTQGAPDRDFALASSTCSGSLAAGTACTVTVTLAPRTAGGRMGAVQLVDGAGAGLATTLLHGLGVGPQLAFGPGAQIPVPAKGLSDSVAVAVNGADNIFITDGANNRIVKLPADGGPQTTLGSELFTPIGIAVDGAGDLFIADYGHSRVVKVPADGSPQIPVFANGLNDPTQVAVDGAGNVFIADAGNNRVVKVPADGGSQTTLGNGLRNPTGVAVDGAGNVFIADTNNNRVVKVSADGGPQTTLGSGLLHPAAVAVDGAENVFIADYGNDRVVKVSADGGPQTTLGSGLLFPSGVAADSTGNILIADTGHNRVLAVPMAQPPALQFAPTAVGSTSSPQTVVLANIGNAPLTALPPGLAVSANFTPVPGDGAPPDCTSSFALVPGASCTLSLAFAPTTGGPLTGSATLTDNAQNGSPATQTIALSGIGVGLAQTITFPKILPQTSGTALVLVASASSGLPVSFGSLTPTVCMVSGSTATLLTTGTCSIQAAQAGNGVYAPAPGVTRSFPVRASQLQRQSLDPRANLWSSPW